MYRALYDLCSLSGGHVWLELILIKWIELVPESVHGTAGCYFFL